MRRPRPLANPQTLVDEGQYKKTYRAVNKLPCVFEKAMLSRRCACSLSERIAIAEREAVACTTVPAQAECKQLLETLRERAIFSLRLTHIAGHLPHGKEIKVQVGGLLGLQAALQPDAAPATAVDDVFATVLAAKREFASLDALPFEAIVRSIVNYEHRKRRGSRRKD